MAGGFKFNKFLGKKASTRSGTRTAGRRQSSGSGTSSPRHLELVVAQESGGATNAVIIDVASGSGESEINTSVTLKTPHPHHEHLDHAMSYPKNDKGQGQGQTEAEREWSWKTTMGLAMGLTLSTQNLVDQVDTQEAGNDTTDLEKRNPKSQFILNFTHHNQNDPNDTDDLNTELIVHIGLRRKCKAPYQLNYSECVTDNTSATDDYASEVFRYLKARDKLQQLELLLEIHVDDDTTESKVFEDHLDLCNSGVFAIATSKIFPVGLTFVHIEIPGLSACYLKDWKHFLEMQSRIVTLICNVGSVHWTFYEKVVGNNRRTLEKVVLRRVISYDFKQRKQVPLDFGIFKGCLHLSYLKVTGPFHSTWNEWQLYGQVPKLDEILTYTNFGLLPQENLTEFHYTRFTIDGDQLDQLYAACKNKELRVICSNCIDREYFDGDWKDYVEQDQDEINRSSRSGPSGDGDGDAEEAAMDIELAMLLAGHHPWEKHAYRVYGTKKKERSDEYVVLVLIMFCIAFFSVTFAIGTVLYFTR